MKIFYKHESMSMHTFILKLKQQGHLLSKYCYCGRLDPMASGKVLFLEDTECTKMEEYLSCDKEYTFDICCGISTDTDDILGIIDEINLDTLNTFDTPKDNHSYNSLYMNIQRLIQKTTQQYHKFSAFQIKKDGKRVNLCELSKQKQLDGIVIPSKKVEVYSITQLNKKIVNFKYYISIIKEKINQLDDSNNYYRTKEIQQQWKDLYESISNESSFYLVSYTYKIKVSSGFYIRQLVADLKNMCQFPLMVLNIHRTQIIKDGIIY
jgi:tRNA U55 pseudouridine synthase TruB